MKQAFALYTVRKVRNHDHYSVKSKDCPITVYLTDKAQAQRLAQRLNFMEHGGESKNLEKNTY